MDAFVLVLHFAFNGEIVSVWPRGQKRLYPTELACRAAAARERLRWRGRWPSPDRIACEKLEH